MNRRVWSNGEKAAVVLEMLRGEEPMAVICNRHSVSATQAYRWLDRFVEGGRKALADRRRVNGRDSLTDENRRLKELVGHQALVIEAQKKLDGVSGRR